MEISIIDIRSNTILETKTEKKALSEEELLEIEKSPYKKKVYRPKK
jgi:hypothetical protein